MNYQEYEEYKRKTKLVTKFNILLIFCALVVFIIFQHIISKLDDMNFNIKQLQHTIHEKNVYIKQLKQKKQKVKTIYVKEYIVKPIYHKPKQKPIDTNNLITE